MKKNKILICLMIAISITLCIPSVIYLITNKTVDGFNSYYSYTLQKYTNAYNGCIQGVVYLVLLIFFSIIYIIMLKHDIFKNKKQIAIFITIISILFTIMLPILSSDIYYYIGDSWLSAKYNENPYYTSVYDLQQQGINDEILQNTGIWKKTTSVYGPIWNILAKALVSLSFGNITIALYVFKIASLITHLFNCYYIYKITLKTKNVIMYGLNPLILVEVLSNVHNDVYLIFMILLAIYFLLKKKNIFISVAFMALSVATKYSTALLVPFLLLYYYKDKTMLKRFAYCMIAGVSIIAIVAILYLPYFKDFSIYTNMLVQDGKFSQSIMAILKVKTKANIFNTINRLRIPIFLVMYITSLIILLFKKDITFEEICNKYNLFMILFVFVVITNFQRWYIMWLFPTVFWANKNQKNFILATTIISIIPMFIYFVIGYDGFKYGIYHSLITLILAAILNIRQNDFIIKNRLIKTLKNSVK